MAKDGTARSGTIGNHGGRKPKALADKIIEGKAVASMNLADLNAEGLELDDCPPVDEYMKQAQKAGIKLKAEEIFKKVWIYLKGYGCEKKVQTTLLNQYAMASARWIQCEIAISTYGFLAKHPTTGEATSSPYVAMSREYMKQMNTAWYQIYQVIRDNSEQGINGNPQNDMMEQLLLTRKA